MILLFIFWRTSALTRDCHGRNPMFRILFGRSRKWGDFWVLPSFLALLALRLGSSLFLSEAQFPLDQKRTVCPALLTAVRTCENVTVGELVSCRALCSQTGSPCVLVGFQPDRQFCLKTKGETI